MANVNERKFYEGQIIYVIDLLWRCGSYSPVAYSVNAEITVVNEEEKRFCAMSYGNIYNWYSFEDYGRLFFNTATKARNAANKLPKPKMVMYQIIGKRIYEKIVFGLVESNADYVMNILINFTNGKAVSIKEIYKTVFFTREQAKSKLSNTNV